MIKVLYLQYKSLSNLLILTTNMQINSINTLSQNLKSTYSKIAIFNLLIVALLGLLMRYKIAFEFPFFMQKYAQHSHSHFAFLGWVSFVLMFLIADYIFNNSKIVNKRIQKYNVSIILNLTVSYVLLFSFLLSGYSKLSIIFSTISIFISYYFAFLAISDLIFIKNKNSDTNIVSDNNKKSNTNIISKYFIFALLFMIVSSYGTFALAYMNAMKIISQELYLSSVYFYLHFQYNGWFFLGLVGVILSYINQINIENKLGIKFDNKIATLFMISCVPAFMLSILWAKLPIWTYYIAIFAVLIQISGLVLLLKDVIKFKNIILKYLSKTFKILISLVLISLVIKFSLQALTLVPYLSKLAYEFRPIVISYLHLVLLCIISLGLISYLYENNLLNKNKSTLIGIYHFVIGIFINEIILTLQGIASFSYFLLPYTNEVLLANTIIIVTGIGIIFNSMLKKQQ